MRSRSLRHRALGAPVALARLAMVAQVAASVAGAQAAPPRRVVTLDEAVRLAIAASPEVERGTGAERVARAVERTARAEYLPSVSAESNTLRSTSPSPLNQPGAIGGAADRTSAAGLASNLDLFTGGRRGADRRRAEALRDFSGADIVVRRYAASLDAERAVFDVLRSADQLAVTRARLARAEQGLAYATHRHEAGVATRSDELRARLELSDAKQRLAQNEADHRVAQFALGRVIGADDAVDALPVDSLAPRPLGLDDSTIVALAVGASPTVRSAEASSRAADAGIAAARARYAPVIQLGTAYRYVNQPDLLVPQSNGMEWALRLGLSYPLFDGFQREEAVTRARVASDEADADMRDRRRATRVAAERALQTLHVAEERIELATEGVAVATEDLRVVQVRYQAGAATILDLLTSQSNLTTVESTLVDARFDYATARAELAALIGRGL